MRARVRGSTSAVRRCECVEFIDSSHIDGFCSSGLPLSSHPSLRSFCSSLSSRSLGLFASRVRRSLFTFSSSSSSSSSFVLVRYEGLKTSYHGHACFPKKGTNRRCRRFDSDRTSFKQDIGPNRAAVHTNDEKDRERAHERKRKREEGGEGERGSSEIHDEIKKK